VRGDLLLQRGGRPGGLEDHVPAGDERLHAAQPELLEQLLEPRHLDRVAADVDRAQERHVTLAARAHRLSPFWAVGPADSSSNQ
jgi:hypothetical protein